MATTPTPTQRLADLLLGGDGALRDYVRKQREQGRSWRLISRDLYVEHDVDIGFESLRSWYPDPDNSKAAS